MLRLKDVTRYVRSKNAGPFWVTVDIFFDGPDSYTRHRADPALATEAIADLYGIEVGYIKRFEVDDLNVIKISFPRTTPQGGVIERDMHSGQQYVLMLDLELS